MPDYSLLEAHKAKDKIGELQRQRTHRKSGAHCQHQSKTVVRPQNKHQIIPMCLITSKLYVKKDTQSLPEAARHSMFI